MTDFSTTKPTKAEELRQWISAHRDDYLDALRQLVAIESVSVDPQRATEVRRCAQRVRDALFDAGAEFAEVFETEGHPVVVGRFLQAGPSAPTALVYLHYDVQPEGPCEQWSSPAFAGVIDGDAMVGRGTADDKGPLFMHLGALRALIECSGTLPVNVSVIVDGEEEVGSPSLRSWLEEHADMVAADLVVISDTSMLGLDEPSIVLGTRGNTSLEVEVRTLDHDVHSGKYGGAAANAALVLSRMLASLHDADGAVTVPGFYDEVTEMPAEARTALMAAAPDAQRWLTGIGARSEGGEVGRALVERVWARPTLEVVGVWAGYTGEGMKTIIPAVATAKISCRLVDDQDPVEIARRVGAHLQALGSGQADVVVRLGRGGRAVTTAWTSPVLPVAMDAYRYGYGKDPVLIREGGTIPIAATLGEIVGAEVLFLGFGLHDQNEHAPNEWLSITNFERATNAIVRFWQLLPAALTQPREVLA